MNNDAEIKAALQKFNSLPRGTPEWMEAFEFLDGLGLIRMTINEEWFNARIAEMKARGEPVLPDSFPGIRLRRMVRDQDGREQAVDDN